MTVTTSPIPSVREWFKSAGLTTAYLLGKAGHDVVVLEADPDYVGGLSRTVEYKGFRFDIGGHRFFSKSPEV